MKVVILGVGRSGTTAIYNLLQKIMENAENRPTEFIYEPFLWERQVFNMRVKDISDQFTFMESLSSAGIYHNQRLPLFVDKESSAQTENDYLKSLFKQEKEDENLLIKFIRGNGRYRLMKRYGSDCRFIFVIRNPIDVINSVVTMFSFFGEDFHKSDFPRFIEEINLLYGCKLNKEQIKERVERDTLYWYYMNRFALESFQMSKNGPLLICYENYIQQPEKCIRRICAHIGCNFSDTFIKASKKNVGPSFAKANISKKEFALLKGYLPKYIELLNRFGIENNYDPETTATKYASSTLSARKPDTCYGKTPLFIKNYYNNKIAGKKIKPKGLIRRLLGQ